MSVAALLLKDMLTSNKGKFSWNKYSFFSFFFFNTISVPSMLSCNPSVFCMAPVDYSTYQRTQNALRRITFSFFDGYPVNIAVHSFEGILFFHTRYKHSLNELPFSSDYRIAESYLWQKAIYSNNPLMSVSVKEIWIYSKCDKHCMPNLTLWCLFPINHIKSYAFHFFIQDSRSCSNGERYSKTYSVLFLLQYVQISLDDWCYFTVFFVNMFSV